MIEKSQDLIGRRIEATDGEMGKVKDVLFEDDRWAVRYLVVDTGRWLPGRKVLVSPHSIGEATNDANHVQVNLTKSQIEESPSFFSDHAVSREMEATLTDYYSWPAYWIPPILPGGPLLDPTGAGPRVTPTAVLTEVIPETNSKPDLRSAHELHDYRVDGTDGEIGHVVELLIDTDTWEIPAIILDTHKFSPAGKKVRVPAKQIRRVDWESSRMEVDLDRSRVLGAEEFGG